MSVRLPGSALSSLVALLLAGCAGVKYHPLPGRVTLDGVPVVGANVVLHPKEGGSVASGITEEDGRFGLETANHVGVLRGEYRVTVAKDSVIPSRYSNPARSGLTVSVPADVSCNLDLKTFP